MVTEAEAQQLFDVLLDQSRSVFHRLSDGRALGVEQHEETITESLLLEMRRAQPEIVVKTFSRAEESRKTGADWAWWWEGERTWFGALVQAKRLVEQRAGSFGYAFDYRPQPSKANPNPDRQIDLLMAASRRFELPPMFALYNGPDLMIDAAQWVCTEIPFDPAAMGWRPSPPRQPPGSSGSRRRPKNL